MFFENNEELEDQDNLLTPKNEENKLPDLHITNKNSAIKLMDV